MSGWIGFWIFLGMVEIARVWNLLKKKELRGKYPKMVWRWWE